MTGNHACQKMGCLTVFPLFSKLPTELRLKIWNFSLPPCRIVPIRYNTKSLSFTSHLQTPHLSQSGCTSSASIPANLHICHESRLEAMRNYQLCFGVTRNIGQIFFDLRHDILYFGARDGYMASYSQFLTVMSLCDQNELYMVRYLAVSDSLFWSGKFYQYTCPPSLMVEAITQISSRMPHLETLIFVPREKNPIYSKDITLLELSTGQEWLRSQIQAAMDIVRDLNPGRKPPAWRVLMLGAVPEAL
ncbi:hypothetical protein B0J13DRAFT_596679 [Dactylonectria estremocensis]|uniref:2EXR domain-containing protein n=1 Tax=Dactylonectria estremocensis TaxID=1079267 RepID=A0A9P9J257_9HYPO|nr:hypothetical protein B0J13DRAFT_596679 [Dactylonectria estremocensis]